MSHVMNKHRCECCLPGIHDSSIRVNTESIRASMLRVLFINYNAEHRISPTTFLHIHSGRFDSTTNKISQRNVVILYRLIKIKKIHKTTSVCLLIVFDRWSKHGCSSNNQQPCIFITSFSRIFAVDVVEWNCLHIVAQLFDDIFQFLFIW